MASRKTIARVAEREEEPHAERPLAVAHQLARRVVDRADVVGVEGVAHAERVGRDADADAEDAASELQVLRRDEAEAAARSRRRAGRRSRARARPRASTRPARASAQCAPIARLLPATPLLPSDFPPGSCPGRLAASGSQERITRIRPPPRTHSSDSAGRFDGGGAGPDSRCEASGSRRLVQGVRR